MLKEIVDFAHHDLYVSEPSLRIGEGAIFVSSGKRLRYDASEMLEGKLNSLPLVSQSGRNFGLTGGHTDEHSGAPIQAALHVGRSCSYPGVQGKDTQRSR